ncbi:MAG: hypothetical protein KJ558_02450 [Gammaproteobacteria bacterium]|nr:hypothetical protein [Gammaproteobacteria bacterium]MBU1653689.1 hypothetical protein [Gammaproteobacteria bacterium]MBU1960900.1 hypothetical protein [Gammaproteobacteria bacterium]
MANKAMTRGSPKVNRGTRCPSMICGWVTPSNTPLGQRTVLTDGFDFEQTTVGIEAYGPQGGQVFEFAADAEVAGVVDGGLRAQRTIELEVLLSFRGQTRVSLKPQRQYFNPA